MIPASPQSGTVESSRDTRQDLGDDVSENSWDSQAEVSGIGPMEGATDSESELQEHGWEPEWDMPSRDELARMTNEFQDAGFRVARSRRSQRQSGGGKQPPPPFT